MPSRRPRDPSLRDLLRARSRAMRAVVETAEKIADHDVSVLILGESGVGKDFLAEAIHACSARRSEPFVAVDCAAIPVNLFESELFGYERGTFTDAAARRVGRLEAAGRGTVYFDEITSLAPELQAKLLRAIEERSFSRLGGAQTVAFEARVLTSSSRDPATLLEVGALRRDLFYRINVVTVAIPPLRERPEDILPLAQRFAGRAKRFSRDASEAMRAYSWPGNVRELRNVVERAMLLEEGEEITAASLPLTEPADLVAAAARDHWTLDQLEARYIAEVLRQTRSNYSKAAEILGINRKTLLEKRRRYGID